MRHAAGLAALALIAVAVGTPARAAESYDNCTGFIDSLPASISTQGTWCLRHALFTSQATGAAISILTDNVSVDCNDYRLSGLGAGDATEAVGINTGPSRISAAVRNCRVQGFKHGVVLHGSFHLVEDNRFEGNTQTGILVSGAGAIIRRNLVADTGGRPAAGVAHGIDAGQARIHDNTVTGVSPMANADGDRFPVGIQLGQGVAQRNRISGLVTAGSLGIATGIRMTGSAVARDNAVIQASGTHGYGIRGGGAAVSICRENDLVGFLDDLGTIDCLAYANTDL
ncbi:right-handed parallel beta-helix repeat-containing protein [Agrilutibacter solisilvae]|uniref:Right-handed parallel beta-helix repeat-containing protein n=1 Tax=Agrilutibacter solisilvae TaxID=2763317 RepID=A0A975ASR2_9GAMM|nr:right-handed parallel beta-helix repeat-containing protein [Lysobacter solisilvae]QSX79219.1 right-handed parallel beta-helix repeat-containing protein [Lysobacter solisilvae]